ncbi:trafficking protein Mon1-domain-containing protein [Kalaharituber pfeilii]|nr:trafficking protein Mon1-domain-containing protein [Kalaharituber pfeilii]
MSLSSPQSPPAPAPRRTNSDLSITEDHFPPPSALSAAFASLSALLPSNPAAPTARAHVPSPTATSTSALQSKPTTAISLPEGVLAHHPPHQDGPISVSTPTSSHPTAPNYAPTLDGYGNDIEGMLGEVLSMADEGPGSYRAEGGEYSDDDDDGDQEHLDSDTEEGSDEEQDKDMTDEARIARWRSRKKHFFILSSAGKPIYSRHGNGSGTEQLLVSGYMGVIQTIVSFFQDPSPGASGGDSLRSFVAGKHRFVVVREPGPLYLVAVSRLPCESEAQLRAQLDKLYSQVVATLTVSTLKNIFSQREGYDLRRLLGGTEVFLDGLSDAMTRGDPVTLLGALECVRLRKRDRERINAVLLKGRVSKVLYGMVVADGRLVSVVRPRRHSLHPADLQVVFGMLFNSGTFRMAGGAAGAGGSGGGEHWIPICLPKFNPNGYLYAYVCFWRREVAMVLISAEKEAFFALREMKERVVAGLDTPGTVDGGMSLTDVIEKAVRADRYTIDEGGNKLRLLHFLYKSRRNVQFTMPSFEPRFARRRERRRLMSVYQGTHAKVHGGGGGDGLRVFFERRRGAGGWVVGAWVGGGWEVYVVAETERKQLAELAGRVVRWVGREEERVFVVGGAVF